MGSFFGKNETKTMPGNQPLTLSAYGTPEGAGLAGDITSGAKKQLPQQTQWANSAASNIAANINGPDGANITSFGRNLLNYDPYTDRSFQGALAGMRGSAEANVANDAARIRSAQAKIGGNPLSTAYMLANQSNAAANRADTNRTIASLIGEQGRFGKQLQLQAPGVIATGLTMPGTIAGAAEDTSSHPYFNALQALQADRTPVYFNQQLDNIQEYKPGIMDRVAQGVQLASKVYGMVNPAYGMASGGGGGGGNIGQVFNSNAGK